MCSYAVGTNVVAGDFTTNRLTSSAFSGTYRVTSGGLTGSTRPIMDLTIDMGWVPNLNPGTYWLGVGATGSLGSGPFTPLRDVTGGSSNLMQQSGGVWNTVDASTTAGVQTSEAAFILTGSVAPEPGTLALLALGGLSLVRRRRQSK